jgi:DNA-binding transcriptional ArsR family regulator
MNNPLKALSSPIRLKIIVCLSEVDRDVSGLVNNCGISQSAVSQHLKVLKDLKIIACQKIGRRQLYRLSNQKIGAIAKQIIKLKNN